MKKKETLKAALAAVLVSFAGVSVAVALAMPPALAAADEEEVPAGFTKYDLQHNEGGSLASPSLNPCGSGGFGFSIHIDAASGYRLKSVSLTTENSGEEIYVDHAPVGCFYEYLDRPDHDIIFIGGGSRDFTGISVVYAEFEPIPAAADEESPEALTTIHAYVSPDAAGVVSPDSVNQPEIGVPVPFEFRLKDGYDLYSIDVNSSRVSYEETSPGVYSFSFVPDAPGGYIVSIMALEEIPSVPLVPVVPDPVDPDPDLTEEDTPLIDPLPSVDVVDDPSPDAPKDAPALVVPPVVVETVEPDGSVSVVVDAETIAPAAADVVRADVAARHNVASSAVAVSTSGPGLG